MQMKLLVLVLVLVIVLVTTLPRFLLLTPTPHCPVHSGRGHGYPGFYRQRHLARCLSAEVPTLALAGLYFVLVCRVVRIDRLPVLLVLLMLLLRLLPLAIVVQSHHAGRYSATTRCGGGGPIGIVRSLHIHRLPRISAPAGSIPRTRRGRYALWGEGATLNLLFGRPATLLLQFLLPAEQQSVRITITITSLDAT